MVSYWQVQPNSAEDNVTGCHFLIQRLTDKKINMKVIRIAVQVSTRYVNSRVEDEINVYVEDDATEKEIEQAKEDTAREWSSVK